MEELERALQQYDYLAALWHEFEPGLIRVRDVELVTVKVAGVKTPALKSVSYDVAEFNRYTSPMWFSEGIEILKKLAQLGIESEVYEKRAESWITKGKRLPKRSISTKRSRFRAMRKLYSKSKDLLRMRKTSPRLLKR